MEPVEWTWADFSIALGFSPFRWEIRPDYQPVWGTLEIPIGPFCLFVSWPRPSPKGENDGPSPRGN